MKKALLFLLVLLPFVANAFVVPPKPSSYLNDYAGVLSSEEKSALEEKLRNFERQSTNEIAIVTVKTLDGDSIEDVAQQIFTKWGIGKEDKNNGVLFLVAIDDRRMRIHTGYGVEGDLTDVGTAYIQDTVVAPAFRDGHYSLGINGAVDKMIEALGGTNIVPEGYENKSSGGGVNLEWVLIIFFIVIQWIAAILARSKSWWGGGVLGGGIGVAIWYFFLHSLLLAIPLFLILVGVGLLFDFVVSKAYNKYKSGGPRPPWFLGGGGFGSGSSFGSSGFGGFGGGSSGGGGSSSSW